MQVILIEDVDNLGRRGAVISVADGYARNYLIPKRFAIKATSGNLRIVENQKLNWVKQEAKQKEEAEVLAKAMADVTVEITKKAGEGDSLYGSVTTMEIADFLAAKGFQIDRRKIKMEHPIKTLGEYMVPIRLHPDVTANIQVHVLSEAKPEETPAQPGNPEEVKP